MVVVEGEEISRRDMMMRRAATRITQIIIKIKEVAADLEEGNNNNSRSSMGKATEQPVEEVEDTETADITAMERRLKSGAPEAEIIGSVQGCVEFLCVLCAVVGLVERY